MDATLGGFDADGQELLDDVGVGSHVVRDGVCGVGSLPGQRQVGQELVGRVGVHRPSFHGLNERAGSLRSHVL